MTERESAARAIGYLEGVGLLLWALDAEKIGPEACGFYDDMVETLRKAVFDGKENDGED